MYFNDASPQQMLMKPEGIAALMVHNILWIVHLENVDVCDGDDRDDFDEAFERATDDGDEIRGAILDLDPAEKAVLLAVLLEYVVEAARCLQAFVNDGAAGRSVRQVDDDSGSGPPAPSALDLAVVGPATALVAAEDPLVAAVLQVASMISGLCWDVSSIAGSVEPMREVLRTVEASHARQRPPRPGPGPLAPFSPDDEPPF